MFSLTSLEPDSLAIPALLSVSSALLLLIQFIATRKFVKKIFRVEDKEEFEPAVDQVPQGCIAKLRHHVKRHGGVTIFVYRVLRLLAVLGLVGLAVATLVLNSVHTTYNHARFLNWSLLGAYVRSS